MIDRHETSIRELSSTVGRISIDLNILITEHKHLKETTAKILSTLEDNKDKEENLFKVLEVLQNERDKKANLWKAIKDNITLITTITLPSLGILGTILYEVGKYLRNLPVS